jgi:hypothetical protein
MPFESLHKEDAKFKHAVSQKQFFGETTKCKLKRKNYFRHCPTPALRQGYNQPYVGGE